MMVVAGFNDFDDRISSVEIVDLTGITPNCLPFPDFPLEVYSPVGAYVDGRVLVCGGDTTTDYEARCFTYDAVINEWVQDDELQLERGRRYMASALSAPNEWMITGGEDGRGYINTFEFYQDGAFRTGLTPFQEGIKGHCLVRISPTELLLIGGLDPSDYNDKVWHYDVETDVWTAKAEIPTPRLQMACGVVKRRNDGQVDVEVVIAGGFYDFDQFLNNVEIYNVAADEWRTSPNAFPFYVSNAKTIQLGDTFLVVGGYDEVDEIYLSSIVQFDVETDNWQIFGRSLNVPRSQEAVIAIPQSIGECV